jgi:uncharacterized alpha-E superfamily protein
MAMQDNAIPQTWNPIVQKYADPETLKKRKETHWNTPKALNLLILDKQHPSSIFNNILYARENARSVQDHITVELWRCLNDFYHFLQEEKNAELIKNQEPVEVMDQIRRHCNLFYGLVEETMDRNAGVYFMKIGRHIERIHQGLMVLRIKLNEIEYQVQNQGTTSFKYILYALLGYEYFGKTYRGAFTVENMLHYVLYERYFPHSIAYSLRGIQFQFNQLQGESTQESFSKIQFEIGKLNSFFTYTAPNLTDGKQVQLYLTQFETQVSQLSALISEEYFGYF